MIIAAIALAVIILVVISTMLLRRQLREKYAALWLVIGLLVLILGLFPGVLAWLADVVGVALPSNLLFILALLLLLGVSLHLSWELSSSEDEARRLAEEVALLRIDVEDLRAAIVVTVAKETLDEDDGRSPHGRTDDTPEKETHDVRPDPDTDDVPSE